MPVIGNRDRRGARLAAEDLAVLGAETDNRKVARGIGGAGGPGRQVNNGTIDQDTPYAQLCTDFTVDAVEGHDHGRRHRTDGHDCCRIIGTGGIGRIRANGNLDGIRQFVAVRVRQQGIGHKPVRPGNQFLGIVDSITIRIGQVRIGTGIEFIQGGQTVLVPVFKGICRVARIQAMAGFVIIRQAVSVEVATRIDIDPANRDHLVLARRDDCRATACRRHQPVCIHPDHRRV